MSEITLKSGLKVLSIGTDRKLFEPGSSVRSRIIEYGELFDELHIIVFSLSKLNFSKESISNKVTLYPTDALSKLDYVLNAFSIGKKILASSGGDWIISAQDPFETGLVGYLLKRHSKNKLQIQMHGDFWSPYFKSESFMNKIRLKIAGIVIPEADCIRVVSERIKKGLKKSFNPACAISVLPIADFRDVQNVKAKFDVHEKYPQFKFVALMTSRLEEVKNIELAILAFDNLLKKHSDAGLVIVGDGGHRKTLEALVLKLNLQNNVIFEGWQEDVVSYLKSADVFLNTSNHEGYCLSLVESVSAKCPVITTDVGLVGELLNDSNTLICPVGDGKCIEEYLTSGVEKTSTLHKLGEKAFVDIMNASIRKEYYLDMYKESFNKCL